MSDECEPSYYGHKFGCALDRGHSGPCVEATVKFEEVQSHDFMVGDIARLTVVYQKMADPHVPYAPATMTPTGWTLVSKTLERGRPVKPVRAGCCANCNGAGVDMSSPETNGLCWDCQGTGHIHPLDSACWSESPPGEPNA